MPFLPCNRISLPGFRQFRCFSSVINPSFINDLTKSTDNFIVLQDQEDGIALLGMNFHGKKNALSKQFVSDFSDAVRKLEKDDRSKVTILCSLVPNVFCAGADLRERAEVPDDKVPALVGGLRSLFQRIYTLPMPVIGAVDGTALGGGLELALACDVRFAGNLPKSQIGLIETHWALLPGAGGSQRLPRIIGAAKAKELMFAARRMTPREAASYGVVNAVIEPDDVPSDWRNRPGLFHSLEYAKELSTKGPIALRQLKRAVNEGMSLNMLQDALDLEGECYKVLVPTKDRKEGMQAFMNKREPVYHGN